MDSPLELTKISGIEFILLFSNANQFYVISRHSLLHEWVGPGLLNAHQAIELYIKAILKLDHKEKHGHDLVWLLKNYRQQEFYFLEILKDTQKIGFLRELSSAYKSYRYGQSGVKLNPEKMIDLLDELAFNLRNIYLYNINTPSAKIYISDELRKDFLSGNKYFTNTHLTNNRFAQMGPFGVNSSEES